MALWLVRAGKYGEHEDAFLSGDQIHLTWEELASTDMAGVADYAGIKAVVRHTYQDSPAGRIGNWSGQIWVFVLGMQQGDWLVMPLKTRPAIAVGEVTGPYRYDAAAREGERHVRPVRWVAKDVPRSAFDQDLLYSFGAFLTFCEIKRNDAEQRVRKMATEGWKAPKLPTISATKTVAATGEEQEVEVDIELAAKDQIASLITRRFKGHGLARLVEAILKAQGYSTYLSPEGADKGIDILAAPGPLGFGSPRLCVQVKSQDSPVDSPTLNQLIGAMQNVQAEQGLLVSWGGFKSSVLREVAAQFFRVRLWNQSDILSELGAVYDRLDPDFRADLPLKRIWAVTPEDDAQG